MWCGVFQGAYESVVLWQGVSAPKWQAKVEEVAGQGYRESGLLIGGGEVMTEAVWEKVGACEADVGR